MVPIYDKLIIFAGTPSGNILCHLTDQMTKAFSAHTDTGSVFGQQIAPNNNKRAMANKQLEAIYKDITMLTMMQDQSRMKFLSFSKGGLLRQWYLNEEAIPPMQQQNQQPKGAFGGPQQFGGGGQPQQ